MKKTLLAALIAATALVPPAALAQDRGGRWGGRGGGQSAQSGQQHVPQSRPDRGAWRQQSRPSGEARQERPQRQQWRSGGTDGSGANWRQQRQQVAAPTQQPQQQSVRPDRQWSGQRSGGTQHIDRVRRTDGQRQQWSGDRSSGQWERGNRDWNRQRSTTDRRWDNDRDRNRSWDSNRSRNDSRNWSSNRGWDNDRRGRWDSSWRNDRRYDWRDYRARNRGIYRLPRYYAPAGWGYGYRRFSIGFTLSSMLFAQQYWINDPFYYRLPPAYGPYRWVRYYNDALLVDVYSGEVVDVMHDFFW